MNQNSNNFDSGRRSSAGGARMTGGASNQARITAWVGAHVLAGTPLPEPFAPIIVEAVGAETALALDDVGALTDSGGVALIQGKGGLELRRTASSDLGAAVRQVVQQFRDGVPTPDGRRPVDADRDVLAIVGDGGSSQSIRRLAKVCTRLRTLPDGVPLESAARTKAETDALSCLLAHLRREWESVYGSLPEEADLRAVLRYLLIAVLDLVGGEAVAAAKATLQGVLLDPADDETAWSDLVAVGVTLSEGQRWLSRSDLAALLSVDVGPERRLAADVRRLQAISNANLEALSEHARLPGVDVRPVALRAEVQELIAAEGSFVLTGDPGCGKTGAMVMVAEAISAQGQDVIVLAVDGLGSSAASARLELGLNHDLKEVVKGWTGHGTGTLVLDGLDAARGEATTWLRRLCLALSGTRWRVVASVRQFDLRHSREWQRVFVGGPIADGTTRIDSELTSVRHYLLGPFSDDDLAHLAAQSADIAGLLRGARPELLDLLRVPFNLRIACELVESGESPASLAAVHDQVGLLDRYWRVRVVDPPDGIDRRRVLMRACHAMVTLRRLRIDVHVLDSTPGPAVQALLQDGVLVETHALLGTGGVGPLAFSHHILFDFAVAVLLLQEAGESGLISALNEDPNLVLVARPSIDFHLAELWHADPVREAFATVATHLSDSEHVLTGAAVGRTCASETRTEADIEWLMGGTTDAAGRARLSTLLGWVCGALDAADETLATHARTYLAVWAAFARRLAKLLESQFDAGLAQQTFRLLWQLNALQPLAAVPASAGDEDRAAAATALMTVALAEPGDRAWLAERVAALLPGAVAVDPSSRAVLLGTLDRTVMALWGPEVYRQYVEGIELIVTGDADLAAEVLIAVWRFEPTTDEITPVTTGIISITSTVRQDADNLKWLTGEKFAAFGATAGPQRAVAVVGAVIECRERSSIGDPPGYPITFDSATGRVVYLANDLQYGSGMGAAEKIADTLVDLIARAPIAELREILALATSGISHPDVWKRLLLAGAAQPNALGRALLPALQSGALFAHSDTRNAAANLIAALFPTVDDTTYANIEAAILAGAALRAEPPGTADHMLDQLVRVLPADRIADRSLADRRTSLDLEGSSPTVPEPPRIQWAWESAPLEDYLGREQAEKLDQDERTMIDELRSAEDNASNSADPSATERLEQALRRILNGLGAVPVHSHPAYGLIVSACETLASKGAFTPGTDMGGTVVDVLLDVANHDPENPT